jgi:hypothetical protein
MRRVDPRVERRLQLSREGALRSTSGSFLGSRFFKNSFAAEKMAENLHFESSKKMAKILNQTANIS